MRESRVIQIFMEAAEHIDGLFLERNNLGFFRGHSYGCGGRGAADFLGHKDGQSLAVEFKGTGGVQSPEQLDYQARFTLTGGLYYLCTPDTIGEVLEGIRRIQPTN